MNIAHILSSTVSFPLKTHHGRYQSALRLARAQAAQGHNVTVYAAPGSGKGMSEVQWEGSPYLFGDTATNDFALIKTALSAGEHDIYHSHLDFKHYFLADSTAKPIVFTQHWFPSETIAHAAQFNKTGNALAVPVTNYMHQTDRELGIPSSDTIYHGIDLEQFSFSGAQRSDRFVFVGRIAPHKGVRRAVMLAKQAGIKLDIIGKINDSDQKYWETILPHVDGEQIRYLGQKAHQEVAEAFSSARAFLFPLEGIEAFGQVTIEAQACGTPVIIGDLGASNELVQHGKTGFVAKTDAEFIEAIRNIGSIKPTDCRAFAEKFNVQNMLAGYDALYKKLAGK
jgi:glycosyltransferase involved in cell wall biosynthesis